MTQGVKPKCSYRLPNHDSVTVELNRILMSEIVNVGSLSCRIYPNLTLDLSYSGDLTVEERIAYRATSGRFA